MSVKRRKSVRRSRKPPHTSAKRKSVKRKSVKRNLTSRKSPSRKSSSRVVSKNLKSGIRKSRRKTSLRKSKKRRSVKRETSTRRSPARYRSPVREIVRKPVTHLIPPRQYQQSNLVPTPGWGGGGSIGFGGGSIGFGGGSSGGSSAAPTKPLPSVPTPVVTKPLPSVPTPVVTKPLPSVPTPVVTKPSPSVPTPVVTKPSPSVPTPVVGVPGFTDNVGKITGEKRFIFNMLQLSILAKQFADKYEKACVIKSEDKDILGRKNNMFIMWINDTKKFANVNPDIWKRFKACMENPNVDKIILPMLIKCNANIFGNFLIYEKGSNPASLIRISYARDEMFEFCTKDNLGELDKKLYDLFNDNNVPLDGGIRSVDTCPRFSATNKYSKLELCQFWPLYLTNEILASSYNSSKTIGDVTQLINKNTDNLKETEVDEIVDTVAAAYFESMIKFIGPNLMKLFMDNSTDILFLYVDGNIPQDVIEMLRTEYGKKKIVSYALQPASFKLILEELKLDKDKTYLIQFNDNQNNKNSKNNGLVCISWKKALIASSVLTASAVAGMIMMKSGIYDISTLKQYAPNVESYLPEHIRNMMYKGASMLTNGANFGTETIYNIRDLGGKQLALLFASVNDVFNIALQSMPGLVNNISTSALEIAKDPTETYKQISNYTLNIFNEVVSAETGATTAAGVAKTALSVGFMSKIFSAYTGSVEQEQEQEPVIDESKKSVFKSVGGYIAELTPALIVGGGIVTGLKSGLTVESMKNTMSSVLQYLPSRNPVTISEAFTPIVESTTTSSAIATGASTLVGGIKNLTGSAISNLSKITGLFSSTAQNTLTADATNLAADAATNLEKVATLFNPDTQSPNNLKAALDASIDAANLVAKAASDLVKSGLNKTADPLVKDTLVDTINSTNNIVLETAKTTFNALTTPFAYARDMLFSAPTTAASAAADAVLNAAQTTASSVGNTVRSSFIPDMMSENIPYADFLTSAAQTTASSVTSPVVDAVTTTASNFLYNAGLGLAITMVAGAGISYAAPAIKKYYKKRVNNKLLSQTISLDDEKTTTPVVKKGDNIVNTCQLIYIYKALESVDAILSALKPNNSGDNLKVYIDIFSQFLTKYLQLETLISDATRKEIQQFVEKLANESETLGDKIELINIKIQEIMTLYNQKLNKLKSIMGDSDYEKFVADANNQFSKTVDIKNLNESGPAKFADLLGYTDPFPETYTVQSEAEIEELNREQLEVEAEVEMGELNREQPEAEVKIQPRPQVGSRRRARKNTQANAEPKIQKEITVEELKERLNKLDEEYNMLKKGEIIPEKNRRKLARIILEKKDITKKIDKLPKSSFNSRRRSRKRIGVMSRRKQKVASGVKSRRRY